MPALHLEGKSGGAFIGLRGRERSSFFFKKGDKTCFLKAGSEFRRKRKGRMVEIARVLAVSADSFGIPHIRYEVEIQKPDILSRFVDGPRVLALKTFLETYREA